MHKVSRSTAKDTDPFKLYRVDSTFGFSRQVTIGKGKRTEDDAVFEEVAVALTSGALQKQSETLRTCRWGLGRCLLGIIRIYNSTVLCLSRLPECTLRPVGKTFGYQQCISDIHRLLANSRWNRYFRY